MSSFPLAATFIIIGIAFTMGIISLLTGLHRDGEKTDIIFGILCVLMGLFLVSPPAGLIVADEAPYHSDILIKRIFNYSFSGLFPWFVFHYTGYKNKTKPTVLSVYALFSYLVMAVNKDNGLSPFFHYVVILGLGLIVWHGFQGVRYMRKHDGTGKGRSFRVAMYIFLILYLISSIYELGVEYFFPIFHQRIFFPVNLFPFVFIGIMGIRLRTHSIQKFQLERALGLKNQEWKSLLDNIQLVIVRINLKGSIEYVNPFAVNLLEYKDHEQMMGKDWFSYFLPGTKNSNQKEVISNAGLMDYPIPRHKNVLVSRTGKEKTIFLNNELIFNEKKELTGILCIGSDITEQELAFQRIQSLKSELEKENLLLKGEPVPEWMSQEIIGDSGALQYAIQKAAKVASSQASVLLEGETGVGKELFADLIQRHSSRANKPFVKVNCGALPGELIEDELFGHEKGAFTGASTQRQGRFELAHGGTMFLDEIGELPIGLQPKMLRVLQSGEFQRIGGQQTIKVDVRIIAATNRNLKSEVQAGRFRDDLFYRLNVFPITIPSLKNRKEDIPKLIHYYIEKESTKHGKSFKTISKSDINKLCEYDWPGNIRELKNVIERSVISSDGDQILKLDWFYDSIDDVKNPLLTLSMEQMEREHIIKVLEECHWRVSGEHGAADRLQMNHNTLRARMRKLGIARKQSS